MHIGLFFGSFNPIHIGHLFIANYMANNTELDEVWFVVSPQNPFKDKKSLLPEYNRLHLVNLAIEDNDKLKASEIEFGLPKPSYTIDTLTYLKEKYPNHQFALILGADNLPTLPKWKNGEAIMNDYDIYVFQRPGTVIEPAHLKPNIKVQETPQIFISASYIRKEIKNNRTIKYLVPKEVEEYIEKSSWYK